METTLLQACLSLPKLSAYLRTCDPVPLQSAYSAFDQILRSSYSESLGSCVSTWSWLKASLPISMGGLVLRQATTHTPAAFNASLSSSATLMEQILGYIPDLSPPLNDCRPLLSAAASRPDWISNDNIDTPLSGLCLLALTNPPPPYSHLPLLAVFELLLSPPQFHTLGTGSLWSLPVSWDSTS